MAQQSGNPQPIGLRDRLEALFYCIFRLIHRLNALAIRACGISQNPVYFCQGMK